MNLECGKFGSVILGNDEICTVEGIGSIKLRVHDGSHKIITEVRYIPQLKRNLISLGILESKGYWFRSRNGVLHVLKDNNVAMKGVRHQSMYHLDAVTVVGEVGLSTDDEAVLWHKRLGHVGERGLNELLKQEILKHSKSFKIDSCE